MFAPAPQKAFATRSYFHSYLFFLSSFLSFCLNTSAADGRKSFSTFEIEMGSRVGFFPSPGHTLSIHGDGTVNYNSYDHVRWKGKRHDHIFADAVEQLVAHVRVSKFFRLA